MKKVYSYWLKMFYIYAISFMVTIVTVFAFYAVTYYRDTINVGKEYSESLLKTSTLNFDRELNTYISVFHNFTTDKLKETIEHKDELLKEGLYEYRISQALHDYADRTTAVISVSFIDKDDYISCINEEDDSRIITIHGENKSILDELKGEEVWRHYWGNTVLCKKVFSFKDELVELGYVYITINSKKALYTCLNLKHDMDELVVCNNFGEIVMSSDPPLLGKKKEDAMEIKDDIYEYGGTRYSNFRENSENCNLQYEYLMNLTQFRYDMFSVMLRFLLTLSICACVILFCVKSIYKKQGSPIQEMVYCMNDAGNGNLKSRTNYAKDDEIGFLSKEFNKMMERLDELVNLNMQMEIQLKKAQLRAYESQINPHFLYNTLDLIRMISMNGESDKLETVIVSISSLLRYNLSTETEVLVEQEIKAIEDYFKILNIRYGDKFDYDIEVDPEVMGCRILKFLIQPLIENSVKHGIENSDNQGYIELSCKKVGDEIAIVVRDNGVGMSPDKLREVTESMRNDDSADDHIGIRNIYKRMSLFYQNRGTMDFYSKENEMTQVLLKIPFLPVDGDN